MSERIVCKRCGRPLYNEVSKKRGYGAKCYKIIQLQKKTPESENFKSDMDFMKMEIKFLKRQLNEIKNRGFSNVEAIERLKIETEKPEQEPNQINMVVIIKELKIKLNSSEPLLKKDFQFSDIDIGIKEDSEIMKIIEKNSKKKYEVKELILPN